MDEDPQIANGWTRDELVAMQASLNGQPMILDGLVRVMPGPADKIKVGMTISATRGLLARVEEHIVAGRVPLLKEATKQQFIKSAESYERGEFGDLLQNQLRRKQSANREQRLFE